MLQIAQTIAPIFVVILLGWMLKSRRALPESLIDPLNRLVYNIAIPAMIFKEIAGVPLSAFFAGRVLAGSLLAMAATFMLAWIAAVIFRIPGGLRGTFCHGSFHGNLGYIGLAVAYYSLGSQGLTQASILTGFMILQQNLLGVVALMIGGDKKRASQGSRALLLKSVFNPVVLSAAGAVLCSAAGVKMPVIVERSLGILAGMALPLALLVIGASLSMDVVRFHLRLVLGAGIFKLLLMPALGLTLFSWLGIPRAEFLPAIILLAAPTATLTYVMGAQMGGSPTLASAAISLNTLLSGFSYLLWLSI